MYEPPYEQNNCTKVLIRNEKKELEETIISGTVASIVSICGGVIDFCPIGAIRGLTAICRRSNIGDLYVCETSLRAPNNTVFLNISETGEVGSITQEQIAYLKKLVLIV